MRNLPLRLAMMVPTIPLVILVAALNLLHPLIHGTILDSGAMDALLVNLNNTLAVVASQPVSDPPPSSGAGSQ